MSGYGGGFTPSSLCRDAKIAAFRAAWAEDREARREHWRRNWHWELLDALLELGGGFAFGLALALATVVYALEVVA